MNACQLPTEDDRSVFSHKVTDALAKGWQLFSNPAYGFDASTAKLRCTQAVVKDVVADYSADMKQGQL